MQPLACALRVLCVAHALAPIVGSVSMSPAESITPSFKENALFKPLEDGQVWAHLAFEMVTGLSSQHFELFPKSLGQILSRHDVEELHFTLTNGRWRARQWGVATPNVTFHSDQLGEVSLTPLLGPVGAQLWGWLKGEDSSLIDQRWVELQHAIAGIMCASLHQIGRSSSRPTWTFAPANPGAESSQLRYGALPRENLCTENLTPWLKLLPCRNKAGLGKLLSSRRLFESSFHTLAAHVTPLRSTNGEHIGWRLRQTVDIVLDSSNDNYDWSVQHLFGINSPISKCAVASQASVSVLVPGWMRSMVPETVLALAREKQARGVLSEPLPLMKFEPLTIKKKPSTITLSTPPDLVVDAHDNILFIYPLTDDRNLSLAYTYSGSRSWTKMGIKEGLYRATPPLSVSRFIGGRGQHMGTMSVEIQNSHPDKSFTVNYYDAIPWFLRLFYHTLQISQNGRLLDPNKDISKLRFVPSKKRGTPSELEMKIQVPPMSFITVSMDFEKAFLRIAEFPPDVSRGFDVQSAIVSVLSQDSTDEREAFRFYTDGALVLLPFPDASMPFNVVAFTSTVLAFFFGSVFNILTSSPDELLRRGRTSLLQRIIFFLVPKWRALVARCRRKKAEPASLSNVAKDGVNDVSKDTTTSDQPKDKQE